MRLLSAYIPLKIVKIINQIVFVELLLMKYAQIYYLCLKIEKKLKEVKKQNYSMK